MPRKKPVKAEPMLGKSVSVIKIRPCRYREQASRVQWPTGAFVPSGCVLHRIDVGDTPQKVIDAFLSGPAGEYTGHAVPYHFFVDKAGVIHQLLPLDVKGQHARGENYRRFGVSLDGDFRMRPPTAAQVESCIQLCTYLRIHYGGGLIRHDATEMATKGKVCPGHHLDVEAIEAEVMRRSRAWGDVMLSDLWLKCPV